MPRGEEETEMQVHKPTPARSIHSAELHRLHDRLLDGTPVRSSFVEVDGAGVHVLEQGAGAPIMLLHGTGGCGLFWLPLLGHLDAVRVLAADRPGCGLSGPVDFPRNRYRQAAVGWVDELLDAVDLDSATLVGHSMGGLWALWYALAHPERVDRLAVIGTPALPRTRCPLPFRVLATPGLGAIVERLPVTQKSTLQFAKLMGEGEALAANPDLVELMVALGGDPIAASVRRPEARSIISPLALVSRTGFRRRQRVTPDELRRLAIPTMVVWGDHDPVGSAADARAIAEMIPDAQLELFDAGHVPYLRHGERLAAALLDFVGERHR